MITVPGNEIASRLVALQGLLQESAVDVAVICQNADLFYFTGSVQDAYLVVPAAGAPVLLVRRDVERAREQSPVHPIVALGSVRELPSTVFDACGSDSIKQLGLELDVLPTNTFFLFDEKLFPRQQVVDISSAVRKVRMVKSPWEIEMMRKAGEISRAVAEAVPVTLREGMTELELSIALETVARNAGHLGLIRLRGFNMDMYFGHVLSGPEAATPAYGDTATGGRGVSPAFGQGASERRIRAGEVVSVDTMLNYQGYLSDQTRNFCLGSPPPRLMESYRVVQTIHQRLQDVVRPGTITGEIYALVCQWVEETGLDPWFMGHGTGRISFIGHGLGIEVDEWPFLARGQKLALEAGMTFAVEPKFIFPGLGITGLENTYLITTSGLESLTPASEELLLI